MRCKSFTDDFREAAARCPDRERLQLLLRGASNELGFDHCALLHHESLAHSSSKYVCLVDYPDDWGEALIASGLHLHDPVHAASRRSGSGFRWDELGSLIRLTSEQRYILEQSRRFGIGEGFTIPLNVPGEPSGSCSFAVRSGRELPARSLACTELIGAYALRAARRLSIWARRAPAPHLSRREVQCVRLIAAGKTDWEIAAILGISAETVRQYVKRARSAYNVRSRTQLVALGLRDEWVTYQDALEPMI
jgi:LuxR family quorum-sensing system transcriptional regulator CciR